MTSRGALRTLSLAGILCAGGVIPAQGRPITLTMPASRVAVVLEEVGKQAGVPLSVSNKIADEAVILSVKNVSLDDLLQRIADAMNAEWTKKGEGLILTRSSAQELRARRAHLQFASERIAAINAHTRERDAKETFDQAAAAKLAEREDDLLRSIKEGKGAVPRVYDPRKDPSGFLIDALFSALGPERLAAVPENGRTVFATSPNPMQQMFPPTAGEAVRTYLKQLKMISDARKESPDPSNSTRIVIAGPLQRGNGNPELGIGRIIVAVNNIRGELRAEIFVDDPTGASIVHGAWMNVMDLTSTPMAMTAGVEDKISLTPLATEFAKRCADRTFSPGGIPRQVRAISINNYNFTTTSTGSKAESISSALRSRLLDPMAFDPQSLTSSEGFLAAAAARGENLLAVLPDSSILPLARSLNKGTDVAGFLSTCAPQAGITVHEQGGWIMATATDPTGVPNTHVNRATFRKVLRSLNAQGAVRLEELTEFAKAQIKPAANGDYDGFCMRLINDNSAEDALRMLEDPDTLRFYAALNPEQRRVLASGGTLRASEIGPALDYLAREYYQSPGGPASMAIPVSGVTAVSLASSTNRERTLILPNGIPGETLIGMKLEHQPAAYCTDANGDTSIITPGSLASRLYAAESPTFAQFGVPAAKIERYVPGGQDQLTFTFKFTPTAQMTRSLTDTYIEPSQGGGYDSLPAEFRSQTDTILAAMRKSLSGMKIQIGRPLPANAKP